MDLKEVCDMVLYELKTLEITFARNNTRFERST